MALLYVGLRLRRREKQIEAIWALLRQNAELDVPLLLANSDFERADLERAVRPLNNKGLGYYVFCWPVALVYAWFQWQRGQGA